MAAIVYSTNNLPYTRMALEHLELTSCKKCTEIITVDNGSPEPFPHDLPGNRLIRYEKNVGGNAVFHRWIMDNWFNGDVPEFMAFFHCDLMIHEVGWDQRVLDAFDADPKLGIIGFAGSNEIDGWGGRGAGTMLNYSGKYFEGYGQASPAEAHGRRTDRLEAAAVLDHMSMIFRTSVLRSLTPQEGTYAPEHFYDRILCCEALEKGHHIAVLGVACDHFSGGIGPGNAQADELRKEWLEREGIPYPPDRSDLGVYVESERRFKERFGYMIPIKVLPDYTLLRTR